MRGENRFDDWEEEAEGTISKKKNGKKRPTKKLDAFNMADTPILPTVEIGAEKKKALDAKEDNIVKTPPTKDEETLKSGENIEISNVEEQAPAKKEQWMPDISNVDTETGTTPNAVKQPNQENPAADSESTEIQTPSEKPKLEEKKDFYKELSFAVGRQVAAELQKKGYFSIKDFVQAFKEQALRVPHVKVDTRVIEGVWNRLLQEDIIKEEVGSGRFFLNLEKNKMSQEEFTQELAALLHNEFPPKEKELENITTKDATGQEKTFTDEFWKNVNGVLKQESFSPQGKETPEEEFLNKIKGKSKVAAISEPSEKAKGFFEKIANFGSKIEEKKAGWFKRRLSWLSQKADWSPKVNEFLNQWSDNYKKKEEREQNFQKNKTKGFWQKGAGVMKVWANASKLVLAPFFSSYRLAMYATLFGTEAVGAAKETRLSNKEITLLDEDLAEKEAWELYDQADIGKKLDSLNEPADETIISSEKEAELKVDREKLQEAYRRGLPERLMKRLEHFNKKADNGEVLPTLANITNTLTTTIAGRTIIWQLRYWDEKIKSWEAQEKTGKISETVKNIKIGLVRSSSQKLLEDMDKAVGRAGMIDTLAMGFKGMEMAGKAASAVFIAESYKNLFKRLYAIYEHPELLNKIWEAGTEKLDNFLGRSGVSGLESNSGGTEHIQPSPTSVEKILSEPANVNLQEATNASGYLALAENQSDPAIKVEYLQKAAEMEIKNNHLGEAEDIIKSAQAIINEHQSDIYSPLLKERQDIFTELENKLLSVDAPEVQSDWPLYGDRKEGQADILKDTAQPAPAVRGIAEKIDFSGISGQRGLYGGAEQFVQKVYAGELNELTAGSKEYQAALIYRADRIKDLLVDDIKHGGGKRFGLEGVTKPDKISAEQFNKIKWNEVQKAVAGDKIFHKELNAAEVENIVKYEKPQIHQASEAPVSAPTTAKFEIKAEDIGLPEGMTLTEVPVPGGHPLLAGEQLVEANDKYVLVGAGDNKKPFAIMEFPKGTTVDQAIQKAEAFNVELAENNIPLEKAPALVEFSGKYDMPLENIAKHHFWLDQEKQGLNKQQIADIIRLAENQNNQAALNELISGNKDSFPYEDYEYASVAAPQNANGQYENITVKYRAVGREQQNYDVTLFASGENGRIALDGREVAKFELKQVKDVLRDPAGFIIKSNYDLINWQKRL